jgi:hypothetical protein
MLLEAHAAAVGVELMEKADFYEPRRAELFGFLYHNPHPRKF